MKHFFLLTIFFSFSQVIFAQNADSLRVAREVDSLIKVSRELTDKRIFPKALEVSDLAEKKALDKWGKISVVYGKTSYNHSRVLHVKRDYKEAERWYLQTLEIQEKVLGIGHNDYIFTLNRYGVLFYDSRQFEKAEPIYLKVKDLRAQYNGKEHPDYAHILHGIASLYMEMGKREESEKYFIEVIALRAKILGKEHADYANSLNSFAILCVNSGDLKKAETYFLETKNIREVALGKEHYDYAQSLNNLSILYSKIGEYEKAVPFELEAIAIRRKTLGNKDPEYARSIQSLAVIRYYLGEYDEAISLYMEACDVFKGALGEESLDFAYCLGNLGVLYKDIGMLENAESLLLRSKAIFAKNVKKDNPSYAGVLHRLSTFYQLLGDFDKSVELESEAISIYEKTFSKAHPDHGWSSNSLGIAYKNLGKHEQAEATYLKAKSILESIFGIESSEIVPVLNNLAILYKELHRYEDSERLYLEALARLEKSLGKQHPKYALALGNQASLYIATSRNLEAEHKLREAIKINELYLGKEHPELAKNYNNLATVQILTNRTEEAIQSLTTAFEMYNFQLVKAIKHLSERELAAMIKTFTMNQLLLFSICQNNQMPSTMAFDQTLFYKNFLLKTGTRLRSLLRGDTAATAKFADYQSLHRRLAAEYAKPITERKNVDTLENRANELEKELTRKIAGYGDALRQVNWQEVQGALKPNEAAIEFVHYNYWNKRETDSVMYAALVLRPGMMQPVFVPLFEERQLTALLDPKGKTPDVFYKSRYTYEDGGKSLYQVVWGPLEAHLQGAKKVFCSPSGLLHRLSLADLPAGSEANVGDNYEISIIGSTRQLVVNHIVENPTKTALFFGGIQYDMDSTAYFNASDTRSGNGMRGAPAGFYADSTLRGGSWKYLPGTEKEAIELSQTAKSKGFDSQVLLGFTASEERFKALDGQSPKILHLATHGFFFPDVQNKSGTGLDNEPVFKYNDNPLLRAGLILAGGNHAWTKGHPLKPNMEDGILTAYEIAHLDLSKTELVVLSACETGLGDIRGNEGVYGLQRAFKIAGAKNILMSLWQVPDQQTARFMGIFYKKWLNDNMSVPDALQASKKQLKDRGYDPFYWAGFVLVE